MGEYFDIDSVCGGYGKEFQLSNISFGIEKGKFAGIIGPNGSGKSTLFKLITGDVKLSKGTVNLNATNLNALSLKQKAQRVAVVSQFFEQVDISVEEYVLMGRLPYRNSFQFLESDYDKEVANKYMELTGTFRLRNKQVSNLSGGEQQLVGIARALTQEPELLLLDEPTSHLDITHQVRMLNLIQKLSHEHGLTILMIIHDLNLAGEFCDYLLMLDNGRLYCKGTPIDVLDYKNIEQVYNTVVVTKHNPISGKPAIFLVSDKVLKNRG